MKNIQADQTETVWVKNLVGIYMVFDFIFSGIALLMGVAVYRIWKKLVSQPGLERNQSMLSIHLVVFIAFIFLILWAFIVYLHTMLVS